MPYTADKPQLAPPRDGLRAHIPGWGVDLDPADRPSVPRERFDPGATGAHWDLPEQQPERWPRERSVEHERLTPVFGTSCPPKGASGMLRRVAYRYSEARALHWLLLLAADRVDAQEHLLGSIVTLRFDQPLLPTGLRSERSTSGLASRLGAGRADVAHQALDPLVATGPGLVAAGATYAAIRALRRRAAAGRGA